MEESELPIWFVIHYGILTKDTNIFKLLYNRYKCNENIIELSVLINDCGTTTEMRQVLLCLKNDRYEQSKCLKIIDNLISNKQSIFKSIITWMRR